MNQTQHRFLLSGGGTGGHIYPALAIADELKTRFPDAEFLFIGASDKMEMQKIPHEGYKIKGLWISGIERSLSMKNVAFPFKVLSSLKDSYKIIKEFNPTCAIGTGGFASGPALWVAAKLGVPIFLQEQNSFPGITNKFLASHAKKIFVAYNGMEKFFAKEKIVVSGNPVRNIFNSAISKEKAIEFFDLDKDKITILSIGGSLGSKTLNTAWYKHIQKISSKNVQLIWQTGSLEYEKIINNFMGIEGSPAASELQNLLPNLAIKEFIYEMDKAFTAADIIVSRAGAIAISELCLAGKPTILVPYPYAAEDHQTKNAENLVHNNAAIMIHDANFIENADKIVIDLIEDSAKQKIMSENIKKLAKPNATKEIVDEIVKVISKK